MRDHSHRRFTIHESNISDITGMRHVQVTEKLSNGEHETIANLTGSMTAEKAIVYLTVTYPGCHIALDSK